jgi:hypothetical protein
MFTGSRGNIIRYRLQYVGNRSLAVTIRHGDLRGLSRNVSRVL